MSDPEMAIAKSVLADAQQTLGDAGIRRVSMEIGHPDGSTPVVRAWLQKRRWPSKPRSSMLAARVADVLRARHMMLVGIGLQKPGTPVEQLARGEAVGVKRAASG